MGAFKILAITISIISTLLLTTPQPTGPQGAYFQAIGPASVEEVTLTLSNGEATDPCRDVANPVGCTTLLVTLQNNRHFAIRSGQMTCGISPIVLERQTVSGDWTALPKRELDWECTRNFMEWTTIEPGATIAIPIHLEDEQFLDLPALQKIIGDAGSLTLRARWNIYGCPAAPKEHPPAPGAASGARSQSNSPQCASGESPQKNYIELTSNALTIHSR